MSQVEVVADSAWVKIRLDGLLHLSFRRDKLLAVQSWYQGDAHRRYFIEYTLVDGETFSEYESRELWVEILTGLDKV